MKTAYLFPGQGSQSASGLELVRAEAPDLLTCCVDLIGEDPFARCDESTRFAQPAIVLTSLAAWRRTTPAEPRAYAGHSLGELSALAAAGSITQLDAVRLAVIRGEAMAKTGEASGAGSMLAVLKGTPAEALALAEEHGLSVANDNAPGEGVLSGSREAIAAARGSARERGLRVLELNVTGAFHSPAMAPARQVFAQAAAEIEWQTPDFPVYSGLTAAPFVDPPLELGAAIISPVRWREVMLALDAAGATEFVDLGPSDVLEKLVARNFPAVCDVVG